MIYILSRVKKLAANPDNLIYIAFVSVFLHYVITAIAILFIAVCIFFSRERRKQVFSFKGKKMFIIFCSYTFLVALFSGNILGAGFSIGFFIVMSISYFVRANITARVFERCLDICCYAAIPLGLSALLEHLLNSQVTGYTCKLWFFNQNYFCTILAMIVIMFIAILFTSLLGKMVSFVTNIVTELQFRL